MRRLAGQLTLALRPIFELILQNQDSPLLFGDLVDLTAKLLIQDLERLLDVGRMQNQRGNRAESPEKRHFFVFVGHTAALRAQHEKPRQVAFAAERSGSLASKRDHSVAGWVR